MTERQRAMLEYADKLTREPWTMAAQDVETLRRAGFQDPEVLDIAQVTAYYAFVNRLADGLGVELESFWTAPKGGETKPAPARDHSPSLP